MSKYPSGWQHDCCMGTPGEKPECPPRKPGWRSGNTSGGVNDKRPWSTKPDKMRDIKLPISYSISSLKE